MSANAALIDRGNGMIYDSDQNLTWLQDANYAKTSGYDANGRMDWDAAITWASNLVFGGYDDWRLPGVIDTGASGCNWAYSGTDCGYNVDTASSEMAYMYHVNLGIKSYYNEEGSLDPTGGIFGNGTYGGQGNVGLINNLQSGFYWSGTEYMPSGERAWYFSTGYGYQEIGGKTNSLYAWAVRDGDVVTVPAPGVLVLMALGLVGMSAARRRCRVNVK
ncbi:MAG: PEP-CTERM sorting domain-containing protein [Gammaproteobacteria bacterium]|nr:PEP-CTERM sorting domain-containing protein [Gammaproteobacteria bacterium]